MYLRKVQKFWEKVDLALNAINDPITSLQEYLIVVGIKNVSLYKYCREPKSEHHKIESGVGQKKKLLENYDIRVMGNALDQYYCDNNGIIRKEATDAIQELNHELNLKQSVNQLDWNVVPVAFDTGKINQKALKELIKTTDQLAITHES